MQWNNREPMVDSNQVPPYYTGLLSDYQALIHKEVLDFVEDSMPGWGVEKIESRATSKYYDEVANFKGVDDELGQFHGVDSRFIVTARNLRDATMSMMIEVEKWYDMPLTIEEMRVTVSTMEWGHNRHGMG